MLTVLFDLGIQVCQVDGAIVRGSDDDHPQVSQGSRRRVGAVSRGRDEDDVAARVAVGNVVAANGQQGKPAHPGNQRWAGWRPCIPGQLSEPALEFLDEARQPVVVSSGAYGWMPANSGQEMGPWRQWG